MDEVDGEAGRRVDEEAAVLAEADRGVVAGREGGERPGQGVGSLERLGREPRARSRTTERLNSAASSWAKAPRAPAASGQGGGGREERAPLHHRAGECGIVATAFVIPHPHDSEVPILHRQPLCCNCAITV